MGAFLAMTQPFILASLAVLLLTGCGSQDRTLAQLQTLTQAVFAPNPEGNLRDRVTPEIIAEVGRPVLYAETPARGSELLFVEDLRNGENVSWLSPTQEVIVLQRGVLVATRGAGGDLMSADADDVHAALAGRKDRATRIYRHLNGENEIVASSFVCHYSRHPESTFAYFRQISAIRVDEACHGVRENFTNRYWIASRHVVRSMQWVSPEIGHVQYEWLSNWVSN